MPTPSRSSSASRQSTMPMSSRRRGFWTARRICPPAWASGFQHRHRVAALGGDPRRLQPGRAGADHDDAAARAFGRRDDMRDRRLAPGGGVVDAERLAALVDAVEAVGGADAGPDLVLAALQHLADDVRLGEMGARHADHVELAGGDGMAGSGDVGDAGGMEDREAGRRAHLAGEVEMRRRAHAGDGDHLGQQSVGLDAAADDVEEVDAAGGGEPLGDLDAFGARQALLEILVGHQADADDEVRPDRLAHRVEHQEGEAQPVVERAAEGVVAPVGGRRPEAVHEMPVGLELDAVEAGGLHALGGGGVVGDDALDVPVLGLLGEGAVGRLAHRRGRQHGQPVGLVPAGAAAEMGELDHHLAVVLVAGVGELGEPRNDLVAIGLEVAEGGRAVARDDRRAGGHGQRHAATGLLGMVEPVALLRHAVFRIGRLVAGRHDAVLQRQVLEAVGLEQRIGGHRDRLGKAVAALRRDAPRSYMGR